MITKKDKTVTKEMIECIHGMNARERVLHRLHSVVLVLRGHSAKEVAAMYDDAPRSVAYWVTRFKKSGIDGLVDKPRAGRPPQLGDPEQEKVRRFVLSERKNGQSVNASRLAAFILKSFKVTLTTRQCWRILAGIVE
jgi:transposase